MYLARTTTLIAAGLAVAALAATAALLGEGQADGKLASAGASASAAGTQPSVPPDFVDRLPVLASARTPSDALPEDLAEALSTPSGSPAGPAQFHPQLSRRALEADSGGAIFVIPADSGVCAAYVGHGALSPSCVTLSQLDSGDANFASVQLGCSFEGGATATCGGEVAFGLAPRGTKSVVASLESGETVSGQVERNAFVVRSSPDDPVTGVTLGR